MRYPKSYIPIGFAAFAAIFCATASAQVFTPGNVVVYRLHYQDAGEVAALNVGSILPITSTPASTATNDGTFPGVFENLSKDINFGVTSQISLDQYTRAGASAGSFAVPASAATGSFSSKSEGAIHLTPDRTALTFMGYDAPLGAIDRSNTSTPGIPFAGAANPDTAVPTFRKVVEVNASGSVMTTKTNAYTGDNGRGAVLGINGNYYTVGNTKSTIVPATGSQIVTRGVDATNLAAGTVAAGTFGSTTAANNFRGETISNNTLFVVKGSGSGFNSVFQVGATGVLPTGGNAITPLPGFPSAPPASGTLAAHPFGIWFANPSTLYVADEGNLLLADNTDIDNKNPFAGIQKWVNSNADGSGTWTKVYTLRTGLGLGEAYNVEGDSKEVFTDGVRHLAGEVSPDGLSVSLFATTSTISTDTEIGMAPNRLVSIVDSLGNQNALLASNESFNTLQTAAYGDVFRGVDFAPQSVPEPDTALAAVGVALAAFFSRLRTARRVA